MSLLKTTKTGQGPVIVFLHGWGVHADVWSDTVRALSPGHTLVTIDLPGYGLNHDVDIEQFDSVVEAIAEVVPQNSMVVAWSMGGLVAQQLAVTRPDRVSGLCLVASTPKFVADRDWLAGMDLSVLEQFAEQLQEDHAGTLTRFLSLQVRGSSNAATTLRTLRKLLLSKMSPTQATLNTGLQWLSKLDMRDNLRRIDCPLLMVFGQHDTIVRPAVAHPATRINPAIEVRLLQGAGHAPFLSHPDEFGGILEHFASGSLSGGVSG